MTILYTLSCPQCNKLQNFATKRKEILLENRIFNCFCGWSGKAEEEQIREISKEEFMKPSWEK